MADGGCNSKCLNLYCVNDRRQTVAFIILAHGSYEALDMIRAIGVEGFEFSNTVTRSIIKNVCGKPEILTAVDLQAGQTKFRTQGKHNRSRTAREHIADRKDTRSALETCRNLIVSIADKDDETARAVIEQANVALYKKDQSNG